jgi:hypothetical protein
VQAAILPRRNAVHDARLARPHRPWLLHSSQCRSSCRTADRPGSRTGDTRGDVPPSPSLFLPYRERPDRDPRGPSASAESNPAGGRYHRPKAGWPSGRPRMFRDRSPWSFPAPRSKPRRPRGPGKTRRPGPSDAGEPPSAWAASTARGNPP